MSYRTFKTVQAAQNHVDNGIYTEGIELKIEPSVIKNEGWLIAVYVRGGKFIQYIEREE